VLCFSGGWVADYPAGFPPPPLGSGSRRWVTRRLTRIQAVWYLENIFTNFERHWSTLNIETEKNLADDNSFGGLRVKRRKNYHSMQGASVVLELRSLFPSPRWWVIREFNICQSFLLRQNLVTSIFYATLNGLSVNSLLFMITKYKSIKNSRGCPLWLHI